MKLNSFSLCDLLYQMGEFKYFLNYCCNTGFKINLLFHHLTLNMPHCFSLSDVFCSNLDIGSFQLKFTCTKVYTASKTPVG